MRIVYHKNMLFLLVFNIIQNLTTFFWYLLISPNKRSFLHPFFGHNVISHCLSESLFRCKHLDVLGPFKVFTNYLRSTANILSPPFFGLPLRNIFCSLLQSPLFPFQEDQLARRLRAGIYPDSSNF